ncbi:MAG: peptidylprolyl isomerase [Verrucomicrobiota bacterium]|jgi:cyclophilin family peptidyl-prolyl cis-trans isomerase|nr:peptidylprolyl isomerase [Verrucomicrobiota bacterium]
MKRVAGLIGLWMCMLAGAGGQTEGIFAEFTTSKGDFTVFLNYEKAPRAVASFVGLATGEHDWVDPEGNVWKRPFFDASLFHRVIPKVAVQGGGVPSPALSFTPQLGGPAWTGGERWVQTFTNPPGITTNSFGTYVLVMTNAPGVQTNYTFGSETVETNLPTFTQGTLQALLRVNTSPVVTTATYFNAVMTNNTLSEVVRTHSIPVAWVYNNRGSSTQIVTYDIQLNFLVTNTFRSMEVNTNFDNAGFYMLEDVQNGLLHSNGVISMANSGPNTDGSQFFITTTNVAGWDGSYTVFGHVVTGMDTVRALSDVAVDGQNANRPLEDLSLSRVVIRREGAAARAFDIHGQKVPIIENGPISVAPEGTNLAVKVELAEQSETMVRSSADLKTWETFQNFGFYTNPTFVLSGLLSEVPARHFFHSWRILYPQPITSLPSNRGRQFSFLWNGSNAPLQEVLFSTNAMQSGAYRVTRGTNVIVGTIFIGDTWVQNPYSARLMFMDDTGQQYTFSMGFAPGAQSNRFSGTVVHQISGASGSVSGWFWVLP